MSATYELVGAAAPPMVNGELVFDAPWQGRVFGIARGLAERGVYQWDDFRARLISEIASFDHGLERREPVFGATDGYHYYDHFLRALETLLAQRGLLASGELSDRIEAYARRPEGHDHHHDHDHEHR